MRDDTTFHARGRKALELPLGIAMRGRMRFAVLVLPILFSFFTPAPLAAAVLSQLKRNICRVVGVQVALI